ncbi:MAG: ribose-5-phosphate isomerase RpiA [Nitrospirae bacterium]|nr:ribose-5-phosphate isomerase RpiA [Nitrospirota bacterium]
MSELKKIVGYSAADMAKDGQKLGLGTGSTVFYFLERLAGRIKTEGLTVAGIPTSVQTEEHARRMGIPLLTFDDTQALDLYVDGADEIDAGFNMIKGGGGALLREKMVASASARRVIIVDQSKVVERLGTTFALPVEVIPFGWRFCNLRLEKLGCRPTLRMSGDATYSTNNSNYILDCRFPDGISDPAAMEAEINAIAGVICCGLFIGLADEVLVGGPDGVKRLTKQG